MELVDLIVRCAWLLPMAPVGKIYEDYALVVNRNKIVDVLPQATVDSRYQAKRTVSRPHHVVMPGFVNAHTHIAMNLLRGIADDVPYMNWWHKHILPVEQQYADAEFVSVGAQLGIAELLRSGVTCINDMYFFPNATAHVASSAGIRATLALPIMEIPCRFAKDAKEYLKKAEEVLNECSDLPGIQFTASPHSPHAVTDQTFNDVQALAKKYDLRMHVHVHESLEEIAQSNAQYGVRPLARLQQLGILDDKFIAVHMCNLDDSDIVVLQETQCHIVHCPESNMKLASGICPVTRLQSLGINVAIGTDGVASNNNLDMLGELQTAALIAKITERRAEVLSAQTCLQMATINGARALGLADQIGSLEIGKAADFIAIDLDTLETQPLYDISSQLVYAAGRDQVTDVWVAGKQLLANRELTTLDEDYLLALAKQWRARIKQS